MNKWKDIWNKRNTEGPVSLEKLIELDGFDSATGKMDIDSWKEYIEFIAKKINLKPHESIYEAGCGSGAFLYPFYLKGHKVGGIDYSDKLISIIRSVITDGEFTAGEAIEIDTELKYDILVSNGVFLYFPDYLYAEEVIKKMLLKAKRIVAILEVSDINFKEKLQKAKKDALGEEEYNKKYEGLNHLYFKRDWFLNLEILNNYSVEIFNQNIKNYGNSDYRFNIIIRR